MEESFDSIRTKIIKLRKIIKEFESRKQKLELENKSNSQMNNKISKQSKRKIILYEEIPQGVLDKSYRIFKSSRLLERFYMRKYFTFWSKFILQKHFDENNTNTNKNINGNDLKENEQLISNENIEKKPLEQDKPLEDLNSESAEELEDHTEDRSKISFHISDEEYSVENI